MARRPVQSDMIRHYRALIDCSAGSWFEIAFPDFPGCVSRGVSVADAVGHGADALTVYIAGMQERGVVIPDASVLGAPVPRWLDADVDWLRVMVPVRVEA